MIRAFCHLCKCVHFQQELDRDSLLNLAPFQNYPVLVASATVCNVIQIRLEHVTVFLASVKNVSVKSSSCDWETLSCFSVTQSLASQLSVHSVILMRLGVEINSAVGPGKLPHMFKFQPARAADPFCCLHGSLHNTTRGKE